MSVRNDYALGESLGAHESPQFPRIMHTKAHILTYTCVYVHVRISSKRSSIYELGIIYL